MAETKLNYTGQKLDGTGLLYYNARYYDPVLARFTSADSIVPSSSSMLSVDYHESGMVGALDKQNLMTMQEGFWFQMSNSARKESENPNGAIQPQSLNRYSYVHNSPLRYTDPNGHDECSDPGCGGVVYNNSTADVYVYGDISYNQWQKHCGQWAQGCKVDSKLGQHWVKDGKTVQITDPNAPNYADPTKGGVYLEGWFDLPGGTNTIDYFGMGDADFVRAAHPGNPIDGHGPDDDYKLSNVSIVIISDAGGGKLTMRDEIKEGSGWSWFFAWIKGDFQWKHCEGGCVYQRWPGNYNYDVPPEK